MTRNVRNLPASVRARLLLRARERKEDFQIVLHRYAVERLLYRIGQSRYKDQFVLRGAMLFAVWGGDAYRATRDLDLLEYGPTDPGEVAARFRDICAVKVPDDGLTFVPESIRAGEIMEGTQYGGVRIRLQARLGDVRIPVQVDVGVGDVIVPGPEMVEFPVLLDGPTPRIRAYPRETVIAEKLHAMVNLGTVNTRMKDFHDLFVLAKSTAFDGEDVAAAVAATFKHRRSAIPESLPSALAPGFFDDTPRAGRWRAHLEKNGLTGAPRDFIAVGEMLRAFLWPLLQATAGKDGFHAAWTPGGPWRSLQGLDTRTSQEGIR